MDERYSALGNGPAPSLGPLLAISLLVMLNLTAFFTVNTGMDLYGFYSLPPLMNFPVPLLLSTLLNCLMAILGYLCYRWLFRHQERFIGGSWGPFTRGLVLSGLPVLVAYAPAIVLTSYGGKPTLIAIATLTAGSLCITHALRDPEANLDPTLARYWFMGAVATILVFLGFSIGAMLVAYYTEQSPATSNFLWKWRFDESQMGYPLSEFNQRQSDATVGFTLAGSAFMILALGGSMLGAILSWTRASHVAAMSTEARERQGGASAGGQWVSEVIDRLDLTPDDDAGYVAVIGGVEVPISARQYERLATRHGSEFILEANLVIDAVAGSVLAKSDDQWVNMDFRVGDAESGGRSGPFSLLCVYARYPGVRFTSRELRAMLQARMVTRSSLNIGDLIAQLRRRIPPLPVKRDGTHSYMPESVRVCLLERSASPPPP